jgi:hypothetical protein
VLKLMFGALIRAAERWRGLRFTEFELRQIAAAVSGQRVVHLQGARPAAGERRCEGPQVGRRAEAEACGP